MQSEIQISVQKTLNQALLVFESDPKGLEPLGVAQVHVQVADLAQILATPGKKASLKNIVENKSGRHGDADPCCRCDGTD